MIQMKKIPFKFEEKNYEIRILLGENLLNIVAFHNNYPANGFRHQIKVPKNIDPESLSETSVLNEILEISKKEILEKRWEKICSEFKVKTG